MTPLEKEFQAAMLDVYEQATRFKYYPTIFLQMVQEHGGVGAAKRLLAAKNAQQGLFTLKRLDLLDHSMEVLVLEEKFQPLFSRAEIAEARRRLEELGYFKTQKR